jgi:hypothetical protein
MSEIAYLKTFDKDNIPDGGTYEDYFRPEEAVTIKRIFIRSKDGAELTKSTFWCQTPKVVLTRPYIPAGLLTPDILGNPELNLPLAAAEKFDFIFKNLEGATKSIFITLELVTE